MALAVFLFILAAFLAVGLLAARKVRHGTASDLIVAGRSLPQWVALLTMTATWVDGGYLLGTAEGAFKTNVASGAQGGLFFGFSLIVGGIFFSRRMRKLGYNTLIDPFESRFGKHWAAVLFVPAMLAEVFWSAELLVAIGSSFDVLMGVNLTSAILLAALVVTVYTMIGGLWSVAYTDMFQLGLVAVGLVAALPFVLHSTGGFAATLAGYRAARPDGAAILPPLGARAGAWTVPGIWNWWDVACMLMLGGIPWNCYFQRVLSCRTPAEARKMSIRSGMLTMAFVAPPLLIGMAALDYPWPADLLARLSAAPSEVLPMMLKRVAPSWVALLGLLSIVGAVTSSFSSSVLSAASMFSWNCSKRLLWPNLSAGAMKRLIRISVAVLGGGALLMALKVQSVQALWFFTSDLVYVLLFPQLVYALFDPKANRIGSVTAFAVSLVLRVGGGEPLLGVRPWIPYPELFTRHPAEWYDPSSGAILFPYKTMAAAAGMVLLPVVSRLTARFSRARQLSNVYESEMVAQGAALQPRASQL
ncbi:MAG TPA: sodium:solute symporter family protein [Candidatus Acidoferrales bacterium]|nr:sodium:solute symporter family protein [Candidatus Acidoferrales bacterium]